MAAIPLDVAGRSDRPSALIRLALWWGRRRFGRDVESGLAMTHHSGVFWRWSGFELANLRMRSVLPGELGQLVEFVAAVRIGCTWCVDFGASLWEERGLDPAVLRDAVDWRESDQFDDCHRAAFAVAEAMSGADPHVEPALVEELRRHVGDAGVVEVAYRAALENMRSRFNSALGLTSQGFSSGDACSLVEARTASRARA
ncbi:MAG: carboxymuconolactone decarboxylase family protein [Propionibacteriales bacterium]|nr:carboxymuconolactone decarboxylase family protein [Propionibacteriales bacterium]